MKTIVSLRTPEEHDLAGEKLQVEAGAMRFVSFPVAGLKFGSAEVDAFRAVVRDPESLPLFGHCASGGRVGALWMIHRVLDDSWDVEAAAQEAQSLGISSGAHSAALA